MGESTLTTSNPPLQTVKEIQMNTNQIITFSNPTIGELKGVFINGEPWFFAGKVCDCLKIKNSSNALKNIKEKHLKFGDKLDGVAIIYPIITDRLGRKQKPAVINETILYELIFQSRTKKAFEFQQWVFKDVLPSLRKHGEYRMEGKLIRKGLTDTIKDSGENERMHGYGYSSYSMMINKSLGLPSKVDRDTLDSETLEKIAKREDLVRSLVAEGKKYQEIKSFIEKEFSC